jgi:hypothetical protein
MQQRADLQAKLEWNSRAKNLHYQKSILKS